MSLVISFLFTIMLLGSVCDPHATTNEKIVTHYGVENMIPIKMCPCGKPDDKEKEKEKDTSR